MESLAHPLTRSPVQPLTISPSHHLTISPFHHFTISPFHHLPIYSTLIASTGFNFKAFLAGITADKIPVQKIIPVRLI